VEFRELQNELAALFQNYVGGAVHERVAVSLRNGRQRPDTARANHHSIGDEGPAGYRGGLVLRAIRLDGHFLRGSSC